VGPGVLFEEKPEVEYLMRLSVSANFKHDLKLHYLFNLGTAYFTTSKVLNCRVKVVQQNDDFCEIKDDFYKLPIDGSTIVFLCIIQGETQKIMKLSKNLRKFNTAQNIKETVSRDFRPSVFFVKLYLWVLWFMG
jgi:hypothetical protein